MATNYRILICGDRNWSNQSLITQQLLAILASGDTGIECVIEGEAKGADTQGRIAATSLGIPVIKFPADWKQYGKAAGPIRNRQMLVEGKPTLVLAFHNDLASSKGTKNMVDIAKAAGVEVRVISEVKP